MPLKINALNLVFVHIMLLFSVLEAGFYSAGAFSGIDPSLQSYYVCVFL